MKTLFKTISLLILTAACTPKSSYNFDNSDTPIVSKFNPETQVTTYPLEPVTQNNTFRDEILQRTEDSIQDSIRKRSEAELARIASSPNDILKFENTRLEVIDNKLVFKFSVLNSGKTYPLEYTESEKDGQITYFQKSLGQTPKRVAVRAYCIYENQNNECEKTVIETAYRINSTKVVQQFEFQLLEELQAQAPQTQVPEPEVAEEETVAVSPSPKPSISIVAEEEPAPPKETEATETESAEEEPTPLKEAEVTETESDQETAPSVNSAAPTSSLRPKARPADLNTNPTAPTTSLRPRARPQQGTKHDLGQSLYIIPDENNSDDLGATDQTHFVDNGETLQSGYAGINSEVSSSDEVLKSIQSKTFNQARGWNTGGRLVNSEQMPEGRFYNLGPENTRHEQYGSGLSTELLKYIYAKFQEKHPNLDNCVNDLSLKNGGPFRPHGSHQNGLDADVSYASSSNDCNRGRRFKNWDTLQANDSKFFEANYDFLKILLHTKRVAIIFTDTPFANALCRWTKTQNFNTEELEERSAIFKLLNHESGHRNHYHIRFKCNSQNNGCKDHVAYRHETCR